MLGVISQWFTGGVCLFVSLCEVKRVHGEVWGNILFHVALLLLFLLITVYRLGRVVKGLFCKYWTGFIEASRRMF